jgi:hypothetical protein
VRDVGYVGEQRTVADDDDARGQSRIAQAHADLRPDARRLA